MLLASKTSFQIRILVIKVIDDKKMQNKVDALFEAMPCKVPKLCEKLKEKHKTFKLFDASTVAQQVAQEVTQKVLQEAKGNSF